MYQLSTYPVAKKYRKLRRGGWEKNYTSFKNDVTVTRTIETDI